MMAEMMAMDNTTDLGREAYFADLMGHASGHPNDELLARMLASAILREGVLGPCLGLPADTFSALTQNHFPGYGEVIPGDSSEDSAAGRKEEIVDLVKLLSAHRANASKSELWMVTIVATACLGKDHLWQDLGLWRRADLTRLMQVNFPALSEKNSRDMKWKNFLYKQLCESEGIYVCRAPTCDECADFEKCFGPEE